MNKCGKYLKVDDGWICSGLKVTKGQNLYHDLSAFFSHPMTPLPSLGIFTPNILMPQSINPP